MDVPVSSTGFQVSRTGSIALELLQTFAVVENLNPLERRLVDLSTADVVPVGM